jgi:sucrose-6-phosphate hydrolase SacC (GH32 family)
MMRMLLLVPPLLLLLPPLYDAVAAGHELDQTACLDPRGVSGPCAPGREYCGQPFTLNAPAFHLMSQKGCAENDPNAPVFDPVHGVVHHFYQDHLARPNNASGAGPDWGHFVSKDFVFWSELPVAIWNGIDSSVEPPRVTAYDTKTIATGSGAVVPGAGPAGAAAGVVIIYSAFCLKKDWASCGTGTLLAMAVPADYATDELLTNWSKPSCNPIMENTQRDPSSPWKTPSGEWRLRTLDRVYASASDADLLAGKWYDLGSLWPHSAQSECPSLYPLPGPSPGCEGHYATQQRAGTLPSHVQKTSKGAKDWWQLGTYIAGLPKALGSFVATPSWQDVFVPRLIDAGCIYASKDNIYPTKTNGTRRINWGWAMVPPASTQTLPRVITFNSIARTLEQTPLAELETLRDDPTKPYAHVQLPGGGAGVELGTGIVMQSETIVKWSLPAVKTDLTVVVGVVVPTPPPAPPAPDSKHRFMRGMDMHGVSDYNVTHHLDHGGNLTDMALRCRAACDADHQCAAWTFGSRNTSTASDPCHEPGGCCCLKEGGGACPSPNPLCISGLKPSTPVSCGPSPPSHGATAVECTVHFVPQSHEAADCTPYNEVEVSCGGVSDMLRLLPTEKLIEVRIYADHTFVEVYFQNGRVAITSVVELDDKASVTLSTAGNAAEAEAVVYKIKPIWVTPEAVRNTARVYP